MVYGTGFGLMQSAVADGQPVPTALPLALRPTATIGRGGSALRRLRAQSGRRNDADQCANAGQSAAESIHADRDQRRRD